MVDVRKNALPMSQSAERRRNETFHREILVLIHRHLQDEGFVEAAEAMEAQANHVIEQYQVDKKHEHQFLIEIVLSKINKFS
jgi:myo-inositol catabolism protein IolC